MAWDGMAWDGMACKKHIKRLMKNEDMQSKDMLFWNSREKLQSAVEVGVGVDG